LDNLLSRKWFFIPHRKQFYLCLYVPKGCTWIYIIPFSIQGQSPVPINIIYRSLKFQLKYDNSTERFKLRYFFGLKYRLYMMCVLLYGLRNRVRIWNWRWSISYTTNFYLVLHIIYYILCCGREHVYCRHYIGTYRMKCCRAKVEWLLKMNHIK